MKRIYNVVMLGFSVTILACCASKKNDPGGGVVQPTTPVDKNWKFETTPMWAEEFDYTGVPDANNWTYDIGGSGWGNNELQYYTNAPTNVHVDGGKLTITAKKEVMGGRNYTSTRLVSKNKGDFLYGRVEIKAQLPAGKGTWPALWMLPTDWAYGEWPKSGEFDIMEHVGYDLDNVHVTAHTEKYNFKINTQKTGTKMVPGSTTGFHTYRVDWTPYAMRGYIDDQLILTFVNDGTGSKSWPFDKRFHLLLNVAIGGDWGGQQGVDDTIFPTSMVVDYVRVYKMIE